MAAHSSLSGASLHEPKGVAALTNAGDVDKTYKADGAGSGVWGFPEPKGADTAAISTVYVSDGAGSGSWQGLNPHGHMYFTDSTLASPSTLAATTTWQKLNDANLSAVLTGDNLSSMTYADGRLTYTGSEARHLVCTSSLSLDHAAGADRNVLFSFYKNGTINSHALGVITASSGDIKTVTIKTDIPVVTNDYIEVWCRLSANTATLRFFNIYSHAFGILD